MELAFREKYEIKPVWNGNDTDEKPAIFNCRFLSNDEMSDCIVKEFLQGDANTDHFKVTYRESKLITLSVESIDNLIVNGERITEAREFLKAKRLNGMMQEVVNMIIKNNTSRDIKN